MPARQFKRTGFPLISEKMIAILQQLSDAKKTDYPQVALIDVRPRTIQAMERNDWIIETKWVDGMRYVITKRGEKALKAYQQPRHRTDGICSRCNVRPRGFYKTGTKRPYCVECLQEHGRKQFAMKGHQLDPNGLCARCKKRPRHTYPSGYIIVYCAKCRKALRKKERRAKHKNLLRRIAAGEHITCLKCDQPRYHTTKTVYDYCHTHYREYQNEYLRRRKQAQAVA